MSRSVVGRLVRNKISDIVPTLPEIVSRHLSSQTQDFSLPTTCQKLSEFGPLFIASIEGKLEGISPFGLKQGPPWLTVVPPGSNVLYF